MSASRPPARIAALRIFAFKRLVLQNRTEDDHPVHLQRSSFELTRLHSRESAGICKDVVMLKRCGRFEVDRTPSGDGLFLFYCHQRMHMHNGFKKSFELV
jgi:FtsP/CotA-like multicopper oxidase with cupredoxin domain